ncbi:MAG: patatin [Acidobacteria bacterium]|nr:MAG: patatin [Acidobacteriota bacterium]
MLFKKERIINKLQDNHQKPHRKIGLALGSGSARGWAHIGVVQALAEADIHVDFIAGTSIGSVVGAVFASGNINALQEIVLQFDWKKIAYLFDVVLPKSGLIDGRKVSAFIRDYVKGINMEKLPIPFCTVSTDLTTGDEVVIRNGDIIEAIRASISVPGIFTPVKKDGKILVDGGLVNPVPVSVVRKMGADFVIAVDLNHDIVEGKGFRQGAGHELSTSDTGEKDVQIKDKDNKILKALKKRIDSVDFSALPQIRKWTSKEPLPNIFEVLMTSINIMETQITETKLKISPPDLLIQPPLGHLKFLEFDRAEEAIIAGYEETKAQLNRISG